MSIWPWPFLHPTPDIHPPVPPSYPKVVDLSPRRVLSNPTPIVLITTPSSINQMFSKLNSKISFLETELAKIKHNPDSSTGDMLEVATEMTAITLQEIHAGAQNILDPATQGSPAIREEIQKAKKAKGW